MGLRASLAGERVFVTGVTGFLGEALLERLLTDLPDTKIVALIRPRAGRTGAQRLERQLRKPAFRALRERLGADGLAALAAERVEVVDGDLGHMPDLPADIGVVIHCAGEVSFDPPLDEGFAANLGGAQELMRALRAGGARPHVVHVSTAYVAGVRSGHVPEGRLDHHVEWRAEQHAARRARELAEDASRSPEVLSRFRAEADAEHTRAGQETVARDAERRRRHWVDSRMVAAGRERARVLGWTDCYTFTKAMTERFLEEECGDLALSVVRPSIIESALNRPFPGWIEGFKMAEPIILAYGRGELPDFPASPDAVIDIIPVDLVVNAVIAAAAHPPALGGPAYYHVCSGTRNPLLFFDLYANVREYFQRHPLSRRDRGPIGVPEWKFVGSAAIERMMNRGEKAVEVAGRVLSALPRSERVRRYARDLERTDGRLSFMRRYHELYRPYTQAELVYVDSAAQALEARLDEADRAAFSFDPACFDWAHYLQEVHCPSVTSSLRLLERTPSRPPRRASHDLSGGADVVAVFDLDGTVLSSTIVESYLWLRTADAALPGRAREIASVARALPGYLRAERQDRGRLIRSVYRRYAGADPAELTRLVDDEVGDTVLTRVHPAAVRRIREHREAGHRTVLLTGALDVLTRPLAPLFDEVVAAKLVVGPDGRATGRLDGSPLVGDARAAWLRHYATTTGAELTASWAYADSLSDLPMLRAVGHPVAVNPDLSLFRTARKSGWPIEEWPVTKGNDRPMLVGGR